MKFFLKIGLPWALSLVTAFCLGSLFFGESDESASRGDINDSDNDKAYLKANEPTRDSVQASAGSRQDPNKGFSDRRDSSDPTTRPGPPSPPLPPNLRRIMKGRDLISRLGSYLDAVRAMDGSNVNEVVTAFEELPKGYGRHLEMKLLMRSWAAIDPEAALAYANNSLDPKSERRFGVSEVLAGGQTVTRKEPWPGPRQTATTPKTKTTPCWSVSSEDWRKTTGGGGRTLQRTARGAPVGRHRLFLPRICQAWHRGGYQMG